MPTRKINGKCLCGSVKVSVETEEKVFDACHCGMCCKWGGGPALTVDGGSFSGEEFISIYKSSEWAERGFCKKCGTNLFYRLVDSDFINCSLGLFDDVSSFKFGKQIFVDHKPTSYEFSNKTKMMTEAEVLAEFGASN